MGRGRGRREARGGRPHLHPEVAAPADEAKLKLEKSGSLMSLNKIETENPRNPRGHKISNDFDWFSIFRSL